MNKYPPVTMMRKGYFYVRLPLESGYDEIDISQRVQAGEPCIKDTRIPVISIYGQYTKGGKSIASIANDYRITRKSVQAAIDYVEGR